jgi:SAM-dependent methyltransferase
MTAFGGPHDRIPDIVSSPPPVPYRDSDTSWRQRPRETEREAILMNLIPGGESVLDIGARDGHFSRLLTRKYRRVTALDLEAPLIADPQIQCVSGNVTALDFPDAHFDCVFCTEVLEHVPDLQAASAEIKRVAGKHIVIGVPFEQDLRAGRVLCRHCGRRWNAWKHLHSFTEAQVLRLFAPARPVRVEFAGITAERTNFVSAVLMDVARHPWGAYNCVEPCSCGAKLEPPDATIFRRACASLSVRIDRVWQRFRKPQPDTINVLFSV